MNQTSERSSLQANAVTSGACRFWVGERQQRAESHPHKDPAGGGHICSSISFSFTIFDRHKMPLGEDGHSWKKKTSDIKEIYDFKDVLGT
ncbi:hypothetical protein SRHO_G00269070 [Serrasalmus rhombeus]